MPLTPPVQKRWAAVDMYGEITGPCMRTEEECVLALRVGYSQATGLLLPRWEYLQRLGYKVIPVRIMADEEAN